MNVLPTARDYDKDDEFKKFRVDGLSIHSGIINCHFAIHNKRSKNVFFQHFTEQNV